MSEMEPGLSLERVAARGMITLRGDFSDATLQSAVTDAVGVGLPDTRSVATGDKGAVLWMSPDEALILTDGDKVAAMTETLQSALKGIHHLVADVSHARVTFALSGPGAREVIAKGAPVDLSPAAFSAGMIRRTRLGQIACAFWMTGEDAFELVVSRSVADFAETWLENACRRDSLPDFFPKATHAGTA